MSKRWVAWFLAGAIVLAASSAGAVAETVEETNATAQSEEAEATGVARASFTRAVVDREPTDRVESLSNDTTEIAYFTELENLGDRRVVHRWEYDGEVRAEVAFDVGGPRWRVHSSKKLDPSWLGEWRVVVVDEAGVVLREDRFRYETAEASSAASAPAAAAD